MISSLVRIQGPTHGCLVLFHKAILQFSSKQHFTVIYCGLSHITSTSSTFPVLIQKDALLVRTRPDGDELTEEEYSLCCISYVPETHQTVKVHS